MAPCGARPNTHHASGHAHAAHTHDLGMAVVGQRIEGDNTPLKKHVGIQPQLVLLSLMGGNAKKVEILRRHIGASRKNAVRTA